MDSDLNELKARIEQLEVRNQRVEKDKAWETSAPRKFAILILTYLVIAIFLINIGNPKPWTNAIVPSIGFLLSTLSLKGLKNSWIKSK